jgi:hypothetical protein
MKTSFAWVLAMALLGCGSASPPSAAAPATTGDVAPVAPSAAVASSPPADAPPPQRPLDLASSCPNDVHLYFGDQPGDGKGQAVTVHTGTTTPVPRGADGTVVVWVTDDKGAGLASVHVTRHMRHVRIDATCSKIDADSSR